MECKKYGDDVAGLPNNNVIYCLCDPLSNKVRYVGKTINLYDRIKKHYKNSELKNKTHKNVWILSLIKKGQRAKILIVEECESSEQLNEMEIKWIKYFRDNGYDLTNGTDGGTGGLLSPESIQKMSNSKRGKKHTEEHKKRISDGNKGRIVTEETRKKIGLAHKGKIISEETKKKFSISHKGKFRGIPINSNKN